MPSIPLAYPDGLPCPSSAPLQMDERRMLSDLPGPSGARPLSTDRLGTQTLSFFFRTLEHLQAWVDWFDLVRGNWFAATWPQPQGGVGVRRILGAPSYTGYMPKRGGWGVSVRAQMRGLGELPVLLTSNCPQAIEAAELAQSEIPLVFEYAFSDPVPPPETVGTYQVMERTAGAVAPGSSFPCFFAVDWDDLPAVPDAPEPAVVGLYSSSRIGTGSSHVSALFTIGNAPIRAVAECKVIVFQTSGAWTNGGTVPNGEITVNDELIGFATYTPDDGGGAGYLTAQVVLRNERGVITAALL